MNPRGIAEAALLGTAAGMRALTPLAAVSLTLPKHRIAGAPVALAAASELIYDKLPQAQDRTQPPGLAARLLWGALAGGLAARARGGKAALGAATGALVALASTFLFHRLRGAVAARVPPVSAAIAEDLLAIGVAAAAARRL